MDDTTPFIVFGVFVIIVILILICDCVRYCMIRGGGGGGRRNYDMGVQPDMGFAPPGGYQMVPMVPMMTPMVMSTPQISSTSTGFVQQQQSFPDYASSQMTSNSTLQSQTVPNSPAYQSNQGQQYNPMNSTLQSQTVSPAPQYYQGQQYNPTM